MVLAFPIMAGMVSHTLVGLADTIMVGRTGVVPLAASAFVMAITHIPLVIAIGILSAVGVLVSQAFGARRHRDAAEIFRHGLFGSFFAGLAIIAATFLLRPHLSLFGQPPAVAAAAGDYFILFGASLLPALAAQTCKQFSEALNRPWIPNLILLGGVLLTIFLNWIFIYGHWGAPPLGLEGAGWATLIARGIMALALICYVTSSPSLRAFQPAGWFQPLAPAWFGRILRLGWPVGFQHLMEVSAVVFAALMMGWVSSEAIAAHQVAITCAGTTFMFALGIGMAASIRVGQALGARNYARLRRIGFAGMALAVGVMFLFSLLLATAAKPIAASFVSAPEIITLASKLLIIAAIFQVADGLQIAAISALRGMSDVRMPAVIATAAYWGMAVPLGYALGFPGRKGAVGIWIGLAAGLGAAALALAWRFHQKSKAANFQSIRLPSHPGKEIPTRVGALDR